MVLRAGRRQGARMGRVRSTTAGLAVATALLTGVVPLPASAQRTLNDTLQARAASGTDRLLVEAREIVYDEDRNTVSASGDVELSYQGRTLQADRVTYDRNTGRVIAEGNARMTEASGAVVTGDRFELTEDFRAGFIDSLRVEQSVVDRGRPTRTRMSAPRAERIDGDQMIFERGTYTACEPCRDDPTRPPLWQVRAARIIHNNSERTIYYENARLEFAGVPIAYMPYFWTPDPTVKRKTGFLTPSYINSKTLGFGMRVPYFIEVAPNADITLTPTYLSRQGWLGAVEWRHRLLAGSYNIRAAGIFQRDGEAFLAAPYGPRDRVARGSLESTGMFYINQRWRWGWDVALLSDKWFLNHYRVRSESAAELYFRESVSTLWLRGVGDGSWFDARGYYFKPLMAFDWQKQQPVVHPVVDYNKRIDTPGPLGGELSFDVNLTSLSREASQFQSVRSPGGGFWGYASCTTFSRQFCIVPGAAGTFTRLSAQGSWRRQMIDDAGQVWTPFAYVRVDGFWNQPTLFGYENAKLANFIDPGQEFVGRVMPAVGIEYRYPLVGPAGAAGTQVFEPIFQLVARPNETRNGTLPNEDAQSLVFDDSNLFEWDKFSGWDRVEGGVRANIGARYSVSQPGGASFSAAAGQSIHLAGLNSFKMGDIVNVGRDSGLETSRSDYVGRVRFAPTSRISFTARGRWDERTFDLRRINASAAVSLSPVLPLSGGIGYTRQSPQPELGFPFRRESLSPSIAYQITPNWSVEAGFNFDLSKNLPALYDYRVAMEQYQRNPTLALPVYRVQDEWLPQSTRFALTYTDECTTFSITYTRGPRPLAAALGQQERVQTFLVRLELRTLGELGYRYGSGPPDTLDGMAPRQ